MSLGSADQILLSRFAFDNARLVLRGFELPGIGELSWLNHGYYELKGVEEPLEVCEVGEAGLAALTPPCDSEKAHRFHAADAEPVLGWRPAAGQLVPDTRWKLERPLGQGGFGEVWLARHETLKQQRVLKFCFKAERARALKREATLFRVLRERFGEHPNIVAIHDVIFDKAPFYLVMDFVDGPTLDRWTGAHATLAETPLEQRLELVAQVADALQAAHDSGIIHRDVKPSNILIQGGATFLSPNEGERAERNSSGEPLARTATGMSPLLEAAPRAKLVDFGIGQVVNADALAGVTRLGFTQTMLYTGSGSGTPLYQAPELFAGQPATTRSDIYSLGVLLWQIVVGDFTRPLATDWADEIVDPLLREDIRRCVSGDAARRFAAAAELAARLRDLPERHRTAEEEKSRRLRLERRAYHRGILRAGAFAACVVAAIAGLAVYAFHQAGMAKQEKQHAEAGEKTADAARRSAQEALGKVAASEQSAQAAKEKAVAAKKAADELINYMQDDLTRRLDDVGRLDLMKDVNDRVFRYRHAQQEVVSDSKGLSQRLEMLQQRADILSNQGSHETALTTYREALEQARQLMQLELNNEDWASKVLLIHSSIGDELSALQRIPDARAAYLECLDFTKRQVLNSPTNDTWQHLLFVSLNNVGDSLNTLGDSAAALTAFREAEAIGRRLAINDPENIDFQRELGWCLNNIGDSLRSLGKFKESLQAYQEGLELRKRLVDLHPEAFKLQRDLGWTWLKNADALIDAVDVAAAGNAATQSEQIFRVLYRQDPSNADWARGFAESLRERGILACRSGENGSALDAYRRESEIRKAMAEYDPDNGQWQRDLAISYDNVGDILRDQDKFSDALKIFRDSLAIRERLAAKDPDNADWQHALSLSYEKVGDIAEREKRWAEAAQAFQRELETAHPWLARAEAEIRWLSVFAFAAGRVGEILRDAPVGAVKLDRAAALRDLRTARDSLRKLKAAGRLVPPMDKYLPWIEGLIEVSEKPADAPAR